MPFSTRLPLYLALGLLTQCSSCKDADPSPEEQLPPITQTGANTFGCLLNGQPWTPQGNSGTSNYSVVYCCAADGGVFDIKVYRINSATQDYQNLYLFCRPIDKIGSYDFADSSKTDVYFSDRKTGCDVSSRDAGTYRKGTLTITRFDLQAGIISGTFEFTLAKPGCDTIKVTQGRFDKQL